MDSLLHIASSQIDFEKISLELYDEICMFCLSKSEKLELVNTIPRTELFWKLSKIQITNNYTGLPQKICHVCLQNFNSISKFVNQINENIARFKEFYQHKFIQLKTGSLLIPKLEPEEEFEYDEPEIVKIEEIDDDNSDKQMEIQENVEEEINGKKFTTEFFKCSLCAKKFPTYFKLQSHRLIHKEPEDFHCFTCGKIFNTKPCMKRHILKAHSSKKCDICGKGFSSLFELNKHLNSHTEIVYAMDENVAGIDKPDDDDEFFDLRNEASKDVDKTITSDEIKIKGIKKCRKYTSKFKDFFDYETSLFETNKSNKIAICKLCTNKKIKMKHSNTTGLRRHLLAKHKLESADIFRDTEASASCTNNAASTEIAQTDLVEYLTKRQDIQNTFEDMVVDWLALKYLPYNFFEDIKTQELFNFLNNNIQIPEKNTIQKKVTLKYEKIKSIIGEIIKTNNSNISFTIDGWTSIANKSYYAITAHFIDDNWILQSIILDFLPSHGRQTGKDLANLFLSAVKEYRIEKKLQGITTDYVTANTSFTPELEKMLFQSNIEFQVEDRHFRCFAHILNLAVEDILKLIEDDNHQDDESEEEDYIDQKKATAINKLRILFLKFKYSEQWCNKLKSCCDTVNINYKSPIIDVSTRWNSTNEMLKLALALKPAIRSICRNNESLKSLQISDADWNLLQKTYKILKQFNILSTLLGQGEEYVTLPMIIVGFNILIDNLEKELCFLDQKEYRTPIEVKLIQANTNVRDKLIKHYKKTNWIYCVILILDPRHKMETFNLTSWGKELLQNAKEKFVEIYKNSYSSPNTTILESSSSEKLKTEDDDDDDDVMDFESLYETGNQKENDCVNELNMYLAVKRADKNEDVLVWWKENAHIYPTLAKMARDFLSTPATSVPSERIFSKAGLIIRKQRNTLESESARSLLCLNSWYGSKLYNAINS